HTLAIDTCSGFSASIAVALYDQSPERVPGASPAPLPTVEMSWHGKPPQRMSTGGTAFQSMVEMSPRFGASGQWWANTRATEVLISEDQIVSPPVACSTARSRPP